MTSIIFLNETQLFITYIVFPISGSLIFKSESGNEAAEVITLSYVQKVFWYFFTCGEHRFMTWDDTNFFTRKDLMY